MLYEKNNEKELSVQLFKDPTSEYRGTPFWSWNTKLDKDLLLREIDQMKEMGMGGFHIHCRSGLDTEYLGEEYMSLVAACNEKAKEENMLCWLYDEDRWPSGAAGGIVTKDHKYRERYLVFEPIGVEQEIEYSKETYDDTRKDKRRKHIAAYKVELKDGYLESYRRLESGDAIKPSKNTDYWEASLEISGDRTWHNNQAYVNTLDKKAIEKFIEVTHEKYYEALGDDFGKSIPAIFTDEPQFKRKECLNFAEDKRTVSLPYTDDFDETYIKTYGNSILDYLPELFWELPDGQVSLARYRYHDHISERFASAFADTIGKWCDEHGIMLTGHMMEEDTLHSQTSALGDCMRSYRAFQLPGIDVLCDQRLFVTAKQASSAAHQHGNPGVLSEIYGVSNWDFDFRRHKLAGDWQAALGVTVRVHHLNWVSMAGEAKRDYPAPIGYQSTWYKEYPLVEDHFSRLNTALTRGKPHVRVAVIHPVESYWLHWGPKEQTQLVRDEMDTNFRNLTEWLLYGFIDFDYISESLLPSQAKAEQGNKFNVGEMEYDTVIVSNCETLRQTTLDRLMSFKKAGGRVIFAGDVPTCVDAVKTEDVQYFSKECENISFSRGSILDALDVEREVDVRSSSGERAGNLLYQIREDGVNRWFFLCHANKPYNPDILWQEDIKINFDGQWVPTVYDTMTGETYKCKSKIKNGKTIIPYSLYAHDSLLLFLEPAESAKAGDVYMEGKNTYDRAGLHPVKITQPFDFKLSEPNVLVLDMAEYAFDDGEWQQKEGLLQIDDKFRKEIGFPGRGEQLAQPWTWPKEVPAQHKLKLRFSIESEIDVVGAKLALENPEGTKIFVNGQLVESKPDSWFVDECIKCVQLPDFSAGHTELILEIDFKTRTNVETCFLLGNFGVAVVGSMTKVVPAPKKIVFGDITTQKLPFYAGNITYLCNVSCEEKGRVLLEANNFRAPLLSVAIDGKDVGKIAFGPYIADLGVLSKGDHVVEITSFGSRVNTFGAIHNCDIRMTCLGPNAWRSTGNFWSDEYQLKETGVLVTPTLWIE